MTIQVRPNNPVVTNLAQREQIATAIIARLRELGINENLELHVRATIALPRNKKALSALLRNPARLTKRINATIKRVGLWPKNKPKDASP